MRAIVSVLFVLLVLPGAVQAQPGQTPPVPVGSPAPAPDPAQPMPAQPPPAPPVQPQGYPPPPSSLYPYGPYGPYGPVQVPLTAEDQKLLADGEISLGAHAGGIVANWLLGFGIGQAIQGRWSDTGWIFTFGEAAGITLAIVGFSRLCFDCDTTDPGYNNNDGAGLLILGGLIGYAGLHVWSIIDAAIGPANHNRKVRELKRRVGLPLDAHRIIPYTMPSRDGGGTVGLTFRF